MKKIKVEYLFDNSIARIILDDGKGNVLDSVMMKDLHQLLDDFSANKNLKLITFEGEGKHFSFGASVEEHTKENAAEMLSSFHGMFYKIMELAIPTLAKISGQCLGGGLELALICNTIFADKTAFVGQPEIILGVFPPPASLLLPLKIGNARAEELLITGKSVSAEKAKQMGLIAEVFEDKESMNEGVNSWIEKHILAKSASSLRFACKTSRTFFNHIMSKFLPQLEDLYVNDLMATNDANEGINSFLEKRKPNWKNN
ncbi:MAG: enoyl-CoA hydratase/isomerase family protein [Flavobacteriales bacterium]|nr:enoyl-CoA hydratase/isomerase family protein [Flavobacteriales bacterium]